MKNLLLLIALLTALLPHRCPAQQRCNFTTDGSGKSLGLKIKFTTACNWKEEESKENTVKTLGLNTDDYGLAEMIKINKPANPKTIDEMLTPAFYKKDAGNSGTFLWGNKLKVDGQDCAEVALKLKKTVMFISLYSYILRYVFYYNGTAVSMNFLISAESDKAAAAAFNANKAFFRSLALGTDVLN